MENKKETPSQGSHIMSKCVSVIMKCETLIQLRNAENYIYLYYKLYSDDTGYEELRKKVSIKRMDIINKQSSYNSSNDREVLYYDRT